MFFTTEITSTEHESDRPMLLRTQKAYQFIENHVYGSVLEIGCGEGYGLGKIYQNADHLYLLDKSSYSVQKILEKFENVSFFRSDVGEMDNIDLPQMDFIICFQFIEHIYEQEQLIKSLIHLLKPRGTLFISTPNKEKTLFPNPWHAKELDKKEFKTLTTSENCSSSYYGVYPSELLSTYYKDNASNLTVLNRVFQPVVHFTPRWLLKWPYEIGNRINRKKLKRKNRDLFNKLSSEDYTIGEMGSEALDFLAVIKKK
ncbi:hypothetical protein BST97_00970 [Nonlabens spongiae]|uniref:Uncharacterized protein n=1 Tax=Nonlabens spongiae TaxID=331648 RepID=A0A1W6MGG3_9FLAO|nr:methyltransferase domain-containing protein [Nonlabens spongiae]ARN76688.1 hypothetical protein BST97_00970 [Nonlabens spongiae]